MPSNTPLSDAFEQRIYAEDECAVTEPLFGRALEFARRLEESHRACVSALDELLNPSKKFGQATNALVRARAALAAARELEKL